jgi:hypothetical protein
MKSWRIVLVIGFSSLVITAAPFPAGATATKSGEVKVILREPTVIAKDLPWSSVSLKAAMDLIVIDRKALDAELKRLKSKGANRIQVVYENQPLASESFADVENYGTTFLPWHFTGNTVTSSGNSKSASFPRDRADIAHYLTKLKEIDCSLSGFSIFNWATWLQPDKCEVVSPTPSEFLRASLATALKKSTLDFGSFELAKLKFALGSNMHPRLVGRALICPELGPVFGGNTKIALKKSEAVGGYLISVNLESRTAIFKFLGPDQTALAYGATKSAGEDFVRFFASQSTN